MIQPHHVRHNHGNPQILRIKVQTSGPGYCVVPQL
jgi:hypothetical protein